MQHFGAGSGGWMPNRKLMQYAARLVVFIIIFTTTLLLLPNISWTEDPLQTDGNGFAVTDATLGI